jgi:hypothetical protein
MNWFLESRFKVNLNDIIKLCFLKLKKNRRRDAEY